MQSRQYRVNEIFYSVQAEGYNAGRPAAFVRFAGCNLSCPFCDTNHEGSFVMMTADEIEREVDKIAPRGNEMVVFTGGEPTLQLSEDEEICKGRYRTVETNGTLPVPSWIEWITISPKTRISEERISEADEIKMLYDPACKNEEWMKEVEKTAAMFHIQLFVQPLADSNGNFSVNEAVEFVKRNPAWRISLQWHKMFGVR